jgi:hypothetical protein
MGEVLFLQGRSLAGHLPKALNRKSRTALTNATALKWSVGLAKRKCGLSLIMTKLEDTIGHIIAMSIVVLNLRNLELFNCAFCTCSAKGFARRKCWLYSVDIKQ